jgi:glutathione synthase/RimK-type ligase-like ATP-grasp enzyme
LVTARIALATCAELPQLDQDESLLLFALRARGVSAEPAVWDDAAVDWGGYELVVVRSTWDYASRREQFAAWARSVPRLLNSAEVISWNIDKRYLAEVPRAVPTEFLTPGQAWEPGTGEYVVKPTISAGSRDTARYGHGDDARARAHVAELLSAGRSVMIQPYLAAVDDRGETALMFFAGEYSHAIRKGQMLQRGRAPSTGLYVEEDISPRDPDGAERTVAEEILDSLPWPRSELLYARVDLIPGPDGTPRLVELELTEPSLFLAHREGAADRLAERVIERL